MNVRADVEAQTLRVQWDDVEASAKRGALLGFRVRVTPVEEALRAHFTRQLELVGGDVREAHFTRLRPATAWRVLVAAYTLVGEGPATTSARADADGGAVRTPEDVPG